MAKGDAAAWREIWCTWLYSEVAEFAVLKLREQQKRIGYLNGLDIETSDGLIAAMLGEFFVRQ